MRRRIAIILPLLAVLAAAYFAGAWTSQRNAPAASFKNVTGSAAGQGSLAAQPPRTAGKMPSPASRSTSNPASLPPARTPLRESIADLQARANAGDVAAASRLFRDLSRCASADATIRANTFYSDEVLARPSDAASTSDPDQQERLLDAAQRKTENSAYLKTLCTGVDADMLGLLASATLRAAQLGDPNARDCYVHRGPLANARDMIGNPSSLSTYRNESPPLIDAALAAGDWRMVDMLQHAYSPSANGMLAGLLTQDDVQHYRYLKLFRLGANNDDAQRLDRNLAYAANALTPDQRAAADAWAQQTFATNFHGVSTEAAPTGWNACSVADE